MFEFGDDLIIDSHRIPWLIWIQLLAMFLLVILLYYFTTTPSDLSIHFTSSDSPSPTHLSFLNPPAHSSKAGENERKETGASTSEVIREREKKAESRRGTESSSSTKDEGSGKYSADHHPCHIFGLAKLAFLKCLGIDSSKDKED